MFSTNNIMSMKSSVLTILLSCLIFILFVASASAGETRKAEFSFRCLSNGQYLVTVKVPHAAGTQHPSTYCRITVIPDQSPVSKFTYHLNRKEIEITGNVAALPTQSENGQLVFSRVLNLGGYTPWNTFTLKYEENENLLTDCDAIKGFSLELNIDRNIVCTGSMSKKEIPCMQSAATFDFENRYLLPGPAVKKEPVASEPEVTPEVAPEKKVVFIPATQSSVRIPHLKSFTTVHSYEFSDYPVSNEMAKPAESKIMDEISIPAKTPKLLLYPNPSDGNVKLLMEGTEGKYFSMHMYDISGKKVAEVAHIGGNYLIERNLIKDGMYKVIMIGEEGGMYSGTIVWQ